MNRCRRSVLTFAAAAVSALMLTPAVHSQQGANEVLCDVAYENCRDGWTDLQGVAHDGVIDLIRKETKGIDWSFWIAEDARYTNEIIKRFQAGVPVRIIMDLRANAGSPANKQNLATLAAARIPMRYKSTGDVAHMKSMLFASQNYVEFSGANYNPFEYTYEIPWVNYEQESIYFTGDPAVVNSFRTRFDDVWTNTDDYTDYAAYNPPLTISHTRTYGAPGPIAPELNFPPEDSYADRLLPLMNNEREKLHVVMFRLTDPRQPDAMIRAHDRGVDTKAIIEQQEYRNPARLDDSYNVDRMYKAGVSIRIRGHQGLNHQKSVVFGPTQGIAQLGSSNWSTASDDNQLEANYFANYHTNPAKLWFYQWFDAQFDRMWGNTQQLPDGTFAQETTEFVPLPPDKAVNVSPANQATDISTSPTLTWNGGPWARIYDVYLGTTPDPPLFKKGLNLGPSASASNNKKLAVTGLTPGTVYYWKIVSWTMADLSATGPTWSFKTAGTAPPPTTCNDPTATNFGGPLPCTYPPAPKGTIVVRAADITPENINGNWQEVPDTSADGGESLWNPNANQGKVAPALASPANYFEATFTAPANTPFHLWVRMKAENDSLSNDSVHVQFNDSVTSSNAPTMRIGTTSSAEVVLQNGPSGPALHGWGWSDNGWGSPGTNVYFQTSGSHTVRVQQREDGPFVDQIVLSSDAFLTAAPGSRQDDTTLLPPSSSPGSGGPPPPPPTGTEVVLRTASTKPTDIHGAWQQVADSTAADGSAIWNPDRGAAKIAPALAGPANYFEMTFTATPGVPYHMWLRMRAQNDSGSNDSVHMQFTDAVACGTSTPTMQIGTTNSAEFVLQQGSSGPIGHGWGWTDNGWGSPGPNICFATSGTTGDTHRLRIQQREDGPFLDQIVLSPKTYLTTRPGLTRDDPTIVPVPGASPTPPPPPWTEQDVGAVGEAGSTTYLAPTFTVNGSGADIGGSADAFHFVSQPISGDISIQARVTGLNGGGASAAAGVMIRSGSSPGAAEASVTIASTGGVIFRRRTTDGASTATTAGSSSIPARWLRVDRVGTTLSGYESPDGTTWTKIGSDTVAVGSSVSVGLAVTGGGTSLASATFDNVSTPPPPGPPPPNSTIVLWTSQVDAASIHGAWQPIADSMAAGGGALQNPDAGRAKVAPALANPPNYFEAYFTAAANTPYHLWLRMRAQGDSLSNDSVHVQFSDAVACGGSSPMMQIGTTGSAEVVLQDGPSGAPDNGWGWSENGWGSLGPNICFASAGPHTVRIQQREDGAIIDQIVLSPDVYLSKAPGVRQNDTVILPAKGSAAPPPPPPPPPPPSSATVVLWASQVAPADTHGAWQSISDSTASGNSALQNPDTGAAKVAPARASPINYFETGFTAAPNTPYHLWVRMRAQNNSTSNDSVHLQFTGAVACGTTTPTMAIGTTGSAEFVLQAGPSGAPDHGWGWTDNGWGSPGPNVCFVTDSDPGVGNVHTVRVQQREDGAIVDEIVISPDTFLTKSPGTPLDDTIILQPNGGAGTSTSATLVRQPYLQQTTSTSATIVWAARESESAAVRLTGGGTTTTYSATATYFPAAVTGMASDYYQYEARVDGLAPSTTYSYALTMGGDDVTGGADHLSTAPPPGTGPVTFVAFGDSGTGSPEQAALATAIDQDTFDIALLTGDIVYGSSQGIGAASYQQYQSWFFDVYRPWLRTHPVFPTIGNHDDATAQAQAYRDLFVLPGNGASSQFPDNAERFYSFDYGPVHFVSLDTQTAFLEPARRQAQLDWLAADLAATTQPWKIVFFHRPPFSSGSEHGSDLDIRDAFGPVFEQYGVQLVLNGHDHDFERTLPIDAAGNPGGPTTYVVTGGGGAPLYTVGSNTWTAAAQSVHHYLRVAASDACRLSIDAVTADGSVVDSSAIDRCRP